MFQSLVNVKPSKPSKSTKVSAVNLKSESKAPVKSSFISPRNKRLSIVSKAEHQVVNEAKGEKKESKGMPQTQESIDKKEGKEKKSKEKVVSPHISVSSSSTKMSPVKPPLLKIVDETAVSEDSSDQAKDSGNTTEVKTPEGGRRSRRSRGSASDPLTPAKGTL